MAATNLVAAFVRRQIKQIRLTEANSAGSRRRLQKKHRGSDMKNPWAVANMVVRIWRAIMVRHLTMAATWLRVFVRRLTPAAMGLEKNERRLCRRVWFLGLHVFLPSGVSVAYFAGSES